MDATLFVYKAGSESALKEMVAPGGLLASITFNDLNKLPGWNGQDAAQRLYRKIRDQLDPNWYTVFTGPDDAGDWKVFVAKGDKIVAFDPPPKS